MNTAGIGVGGSNALSLDVMTAQRSYNAINQNGLTAAAGAGNILTLSADFQVSIGGNALANQNKAFAGLQISDDDDVWWSGTNQGVTKTDFTIARRGANGQIFGINAPGAAIDGWHNVSNFGLVDGVTAGTSDWFKMEIVLTDNGATYDADYNLYDAGGSVIHTYSAATTYASGTTLYGGFTTGYNDVEDGAGTPLVINSVNDVTGVSIDNFSFTGPAAVPEPTSLSLLALGLLGTVAFRRRSL
ncbi:PEP-CTERM sorting domain-containing protein [Mariniblastus fucicola]|uniref:PEP-CTERM motif protein n=1 Tax=Mariniblastus fucicola TaxID=980251 RepID=A0A5B9PG17_9BACT|nr:PEP-CTERM sorting domain-containing protein [Mariniblastus fucicola]QEG23702.1 PEP-CTERM motif protein [Mariniblastus fucicola]